MSDKTIPENIRQAADLIKAQLTADNDTGVIKAAKNSFEKTLPEGLTMDQVKSSLEAMSEYAAASALAFGEVAIEVLKANPELKKVSGDMPIANKSKVSHSMRRYVSGQIPGSDNERWERYGDMRSHLELQGLSSKSSNMQRIYENLSEEAASSLK